MRQVTVYTRCPFCGGTIPLTTHPAPVTITDATDRFSGRPTVCAHPNCGRPFSVRRGDVFVRQARDINEPML